MVFLYYTGSSYNEAKEVPNEVISGVQEEILAFTIGGNDKICDEYFIIGWVGDHLVQTSNFAK